MTLLSSDFSGLLYYNPAGPGFNPVVSATLTGPNNVDEGATATFNLITWGVADGHTLYWYVALSDSITWNRLTALNGLVTINNNQGSFTVTVSADITTASGPQVYSVHIAKSANDINDIAAKYGIVVNDTSQSQPASLIFNGSSNYIELTGTPSDWALGTTWTIEWWSKADTATIASGPGLWTVMCQNYNGNGIDIVYQDAKLKINNGTVLANEPTVGVWTHVALVNNAGTLTLYYNGTSVHTGGNWNLGNTTDTLIIGRRGPGNFQFFPGKLTGIRITNTAVYTGTFDPYTVALPPAKITGTRLLMNPVSDNVLDDLSDSNHGFGVGSNAGDSSDYPSGPLTVLVTGYNVNNPILLPDIAGNPDLTPVVAGWTVTGPNGYTGVIVDVYIPQGNTVNWVVVVSVQPVDAGYYTFTPP